MNLIKYLFAAFVWCVFCFVPVYLWMIPEYPELIFIMGSIYAGGL